MSIVFECEQCGRHYQVADNLAGKRGRCKQCGHIFTFPVPQGLTAADIYGLDADSQPDEPPADQPVPTTKAKKKKTKASGLFGLAALPLWGFNVYRGAIAVVLVAALLAAGVPKFVLAMCGMGLCVAPFIASGFTYRFGVAFRDGPIAGLLYIFFVPYRIHYRLTHQKLFQTLRAPTLTLRDFTLLLMGLCFLPVVILAAKEMDKLGRNRPPEIDWTRFAGQPGNADHAAEKAPPRPRLAGPSLSGFGKRTPHENAPAQPAPADAATDEPGAKAAATDEPPAAAPAPRVADADARPPESASGEPQTGRPPLFQRGPRPPSLARSSRRAAASPFGPEQIVTVTVSCAADSETTERLNKAIIAIVKSTTNSDWRVSYSRVGDKTIFTAGPITDPKAFVNKIDFGKVTRVEGRSVEVEAGP